MTVQETIAKELGILLAQADAAITLLDEGATVPFIARYRKEVTQDLDPEKLRKLEERLYYIRALEERRTTILHSIREQGKLTEKLEKSLLEASTKARLEDLYLPYRPKKRTKAQLAREAGLEPLALLLLSDTSLIPEREAAAYLSPEKGIETEEVALEGARQILLERLTEEADLLGALRVHLQKTAMVSAHLKKEIKANIAQKYRDYGNYRESFKKIPSHRALALFRGRRDGALALQLDAQEASTFAQERIEKEISVLTQGQPLNAWLKGLIEIAYQEKLLPKLESELLAQLREVADESAIVVFTRNLRNLLLAAPLGAKKILGLDPGIRTGIKVAVVDETGKLLDYSTVFPFAPQNAWHEAIATLAKLAAKHRVEVIAIGNGTGSRDTERLVSEMQTMYPDLLLSKVLVNEAGASVYSASPLAAEEFPDLDVTLRGAVSIARRLQDPLAELVKIEPKSIGVGQYQHDVHQSRLARSLDAVVEDCVNLVGVEVNTASQALLARVSGLNVQLAKNLVQYRDEHGPFPHREALLAVPRMGAKTFQQAAGFLRIQNGEQPLDASAVHPEAYLLVEKILQRKNITLLELLGNSEMLKTLDAAEFVDAQFGLPTVRDVLTELEKPGRDPRLQYLKVEFQEGVETIADLELGMILQGVVTNVTNFGAFVNIGVHQDGLVHISALAARFVSDPHAVIKTGDIVKVKVVEIDKARQRIGLSMRLEEESKNPQPVKPKVPKHELAKNSQKPKEPSVAKEPFKTKGMFNTAMADAFAKLKLRP